LKEEGGGEIEYTLPEFETSIRILYPVNYTKHCSLLHLGLTESLQPSSASRDDTSLSFHAIRAGNSFLFPQDVGTGRTVWLPARYMGETQSNLLIHRTALLFYYKSSRAHINLMVSKMNACWRFPPASRDFCSE
jgi:hypothetical protein